jgi:hypothetical protein
VNRALYEQRLEQHQSGLISMREGRTGVPAKACRDGCRKYIEISPRLAIVCDFTFASEASVADARASFPMLEFHRGSSGQTGWQLALGVS